MSKELFKIPYEIKPKGMSKAKHTILPGRLGEAVVVRHSDKKRNVKDGLYPAKITHKYKNPRDPFKKN